MPTVYGDIKYLDNISFLKKYAKNTMICTSDHETEKFYKDLRAVCKQYGFRYSICKIPVSKGGPVKNAYSIYKGFFARKKLPMRKGASCILIDADTYAKENVNNLVRAFLSSGTEIASLRCEVADESSLIQQLQGFEYRLAMDNRRMDPWLTSGACNISTAGLYKKIFEYHSDFFAGGDIEIGKLAYTAGYKVEHIDFTFYTDAPSTIKDWFNQRIIWYAGGFRHYIVSINRFGWHHFFLLFYNAVLTYILFPIRWLEVLFFPQLMLMLIVVGWSYTFILTFGKGWRPSYLLLPVYSFVQTMVIVPFGVVRYLMIAVKSRSLGRFKGMPNIVTNGAYTKLVDTTLNYATAAILLYLSYYFVLSRISFWAISSL
ncbi:glycosyltransferase family 2 protein [Candidatus Saccharibacteria bacterium]|nr:glycosyltransferase family 2 protein [Candidatus Saccharibacteria bacterium]